MRHVRLAEENVSTEVSAYYHYKVNTQHGKIMRLFLRLLRKVEAVFIWQHRAE